MVIVLLNLFIKNIVNVYFKLKLNELWNGKPVLYHVGPFNAGHLFDHLLLSIFQIYCHILLRYLHRLWKDCYMYTLFSCECLEVMYGKPVLEISIKSKPIVRVGQYSVKKKQISPKWDWLKEMYAIVSWHVNYNSEVTCN